MQSSPKPIPVMTAGNTHLRVRDVIQTAGVELDSPDDQLSMEDTLLTGVFLHKELRSGLTLHISDVTEERAFTASSLIPQGFSCIFFLDGEIDLSIGDRKFSFHGNSNTDINGTAIMCTGDESFRRASKGCQHLCHLVVTATPEWLHLDAMEDLSDKQNAARLFKNNLADHRWTLTHRMSELVKQMIAPSPLLPELHNLYLEGRAVEIIAETMSALMQSDRSTISHASPSRYDSARLQRAKDFIGSQLTNRLSVEQIAREAGISASGLQRLFRMTEGHSVFEYVRIIRLQRALFALKTAEAGIQEACEIAGYTSAANFATAFRRQFGLSPRDVQSNVIRHN